MGRGDRGPDASLTAMGAKSSLQLALARNTIALPRVCHVGDLDPRKKVEGREGTGLSVSRDPEAWREIAELGSDTPLWMLERAGGSFVDLRRALRSRTVYRALMAWAESGGYAALEPVWELRVYNDNDEPRWIWCDSVEEAREEREEGDSRRYPIRRRLRWRLTPKGARRSGAAGQQADDLALIFYCEDHVPSVDGVWWENEYAYLSAPHGVIFARSLPTWTRTPLADAEWYRILDEGEA